jgi:hypothetical protein
MCCVARRDGSARPGLEEWADEGLLDLDEDSLVPMWFPWQIEDVEFSRDVRRQSFNAYLGVIYQTSRPARRWCRATMRWPSSRRGSASFWPRYTSSVRC